MRPGSLPAACDAGSGSSIRHSKDRRAKREMHCSNRAATVRAMSTPSDERLPTRRSDFRVLRAITTRWHDNDHYGHVNNVVYYAYFDTAVNGFLIEASGTDIRELPAIGIVAETSCRFLRELSFPDTVHAGLALEKLGNSSVVYRIGLFRNEESEPAALGRFVHVYVDAATRRPVPVPAPIRAALTALDEGYVGFGALP
jgi:acyl-CoA thioester hydrolase